jgi:hypothetical protein
MFTSWTQIVNLFVMRTELVLATFNWDGRSVMAKVSNAHRLSVRDRCELRVVVRFRCVYLQHLGAGFGAGPAMRPTPFSIAGRELEHFSVLPALAPRRSAPKAEMNQPNQVPEQTHKPFTHVPTGQGFWAQLYGVYAHLNWG